MFSKKPKKLIILTACAMLTWAWCPGCSDDKKKTGETCSNNTDCADSLCHSGICVSRNPLSNGNPCQNSGYCKSLNCTAGKCVQNTLTGGSECLNDEECASQTCSSGTCGVSSPDSGSGRDDAGTGSPDTSAVTPDTSAATPDTSICQPPKKLCGVDCVDTSTDKAHCGDCDKPCQPGQDCMGGKCYSP